MQNPHSLSEVDNRIQAIITNLWKRFPDLFERHSRDDLSQEGWLYYLEATKGYKTQAPRFRFVKYGLMLYQRPRGSTRFEHIDASTKLLDLWFSARPIIDVLDLLKRLPLYLKKIVLKKLNDIPLNQKEHKRLQRSIPALREIWLPYYMQVTDSAR